MLEESKKGIDRRTFVKQAGGAMLAAGMERQVICARAGGERPHSFRSTRLWRPSQGHVHMVELAAKQMPVETVAVCDLWTWRGSTGRPR